MSASLHRAARLFSIEEADPSSPLVHAIWRTRSEPADAFISVARAHWTIAFTRIRGETFVTLRGPETHATHAAIPQDAEFFGIHFRLGTYMPALPMAPLVDNAETLPQLSPRSFLFDGSRWEMPRFDNADVFVERLVRKGFLKHDPILDVIARAGFSDQPHLTRSLKRFAGQTPGEILRESVAFIQDF